MPELVLIALGGGILLVLVLTHMGNGRGAIVEDVFYIEEDGHDADEGGD